MRRSKWLAALMLTALLIAISTSSRAEPPVIVAAASDLKFALNEVAQRYQTDTGHALRLSYGSSGNFVQQIAQGAPFDLFLSADESYVFELNRRGLTMGEGVLYAIGHVVLFTPNGSPVHADAQLQDLKLALADGRLQKLAIANPKFAPYGRAARAVLQSRGLWEAAQPHLVYGENVAQAAQFAASASTQAGIFALSLARSPNYAKAGAYVILNDDWHAPLRQRMVLLKRSAAAAQLFYEYMQQPAARAIFKRYGFALPGE